MLAAPAARACALLLLLACAPAVFAGCPMAGLWRDDPKPEHASAGAAGAARRLQAVASPPPPPQPLGVRIAADTARAAAAGCNLASLQQLGPVLPPQPAQGTVDARVKAIAWQVMTSPVVGMGTAARPNWRIPIATFPRVAFHDAGTYNRCVEGA
jgi:hypothetical protein